MKPMLKKNLKLSEMFSISWFLTPAIAAARVLEGEASFDQAVKDLPGIQHGLVRALARVQARG